MTQENNLQSEQEEKVFPYWYDGKRIDETEFCKDFLRSHPMLCIGGRFITTEGVIEDEDRLKKDIFDTVSSCIVSGLSRQINSLLELLRMTCYAPPLPVHIERIHVANGTYYLSGFFTEEKEFCMGRLPVAYNPEAEAPVQWLRFLNELLDPEDILTLQEYIGYCLIPTNKAQKMLILTGKGGEGKSRIGLLLRAIFGECQLNDSIQKIETSKFARADLEHKLIMVDDDMKMEALPKTNYIKQIVTLEDKMDIERKGKQSVQGTVYARFLCFSNGSLSALHDRSNGFYRRQLLIATKDRPEERRDDPFLVEKFIKEKEGIFLWALEGLHRLIDQNFQFTVSDRSQKNLQEAMDDSNNIPDFLSSGYIRLEQGTHAKSTQLYAAYDRWCRDNLEKPLAQKTFVQYLRQNEKQYSIRYSKNVQDGNRGFFGILVQVNTEIGRWCDES